MFHGIAPLELDSEPWLSEWANMTPAVTREAQGGGGPGGLELGKGVMSGWVLIIPQPLCAHSCLSAKANGHTSFLSLLSYLYILIFTFPFTYLSFMF